MSKAKKIAPEDLEAARRMLGSTAP